MQQAIELWTLAKPAVMEGVAGVGIWTAIRSAVPITLDEDTFVIGIPSQMNELAGHLRMPSTKRLIDNELAKHIGRPVSSRVIDGTTLEEWTAIKRKDQEARRLQEQSLQRMRTELEARQSWDTVYEQLSRRYAAITNKSLPQNRARFLEEAAELIASARREQTNHDDLSERNFARCLERVAQYTELPATLVASFVLQRVGEI